MISSRPSSDPRFLRHVFGAFPTGVALVAARIDGRPVGMLANSFTSVSLAPPLVSLNFDRSSTTWPRLRKADSWGISVLAEDQSDLMRHLAGPSDHRFEGIDMLDTPSGALHVPDAAATLTVSPHAEVDAGDHVLTLLAVDDLDRRDDRRPLVFHDGSLRMLCA